MTSIRKGRHSARFLPGEERCAFFTLHTPGREQEAAVLLFIFYSWQRALTPSWDTEFIILREIELICFLDFNLWLRSLVLFSFWGSYYSVLIIIF